MSKKNISKATCAKDETNGFAPLDGYTPKECYARRKAKYDSFYFQLVVLCSIVAAATVAAAVIANVFVGIAVAIALALIYTYFSRDELKRSLGVKIKACDGGIAIVSFSALTISREEAWIPDRLMWYDVTSLCEGALDNEKNAELCVLHIPHTLTHIEKGAFNGCEALHTLCFECEECELEKITVCEDLSRFTLTFGVKYPEKHKEEADK